MRPPCALREVRGTFSVGTRHADRVRCCSLITLRFIEGRLYLDPIRECYEAFVIYNFYMFLTAYLVRDRRRLGFRTRA